MKQIMLNGAEMTTRADAYAHIRNAFDCPDCGANLDALWDVLSTTCALATLRSPAPMLNGLGSYGCRMLGLFYKAAEETETLRFSVEV